MSLTNRIRNSQIITPTQKTLYTSGEQKNSYADFAASTSKYYGHSPGIISIISLPPCSTSTSISSLMERILTMPNSVFQNLIDTPQKPQKNDNHYHNNYKNYNDKHTLYETSPINMPFKRHYSTS